MSASKDRRAVIAAVALLFVTPLGLVGCPSLDGLVHDDASAPADCGAGSTLHYLSLDEATRFCSKALTCPNLATSTLLSLGIPIDTKNFSACLDWLAGPIPPDRVGIAEAALYLSCAANAANCPQANSCMWAEQIDPNDPRCNGVDASSACSGNGQDVLWCQSHQIYHCNSSYYYPGSTCIAATDPAHPDAGNVGHYCEVSSSCSSQSTTCQNNVITYCTTTGSTESFDCAVEGFGCGFNEAEGLTDCLANTCISGAPACSDGGVAVCDGYYVGQFDCAAMGASCQTRNGGVPRCGSSCDVCSVDDPDVDVCTGNVISICVGGQRSTIDCTTLGLTCVAAASGVSAHCE